jgi:pimeloyl-ACP methyl ester carboxylesterase
VATIIIIPCHFLGGAAWEPVRREVEAAGHILLPLDLRGWGDRRAALAPDIGLAAHVADVVEALEAGDLRDVTLVGHSYGGMVVAGVAAHAAGRLGRLVFLDAPVPRDGDTMFDHLPDFVAEWYREQAAAAGNGWRVSAPDLGMHGLSDADMTWLTPMLGAVPLRTCEEPLEAPGDPAWALPRTFIWCREYPLFAEAAARARTDQDSGYDELPSGHLPMVTHPAETARLLVRVAEGMTTAHR